MSDIERRELLLKAYDLERQDERSFWTTTAAYMGAAATILVTVTVVAKPSAWGVWVVAPLVGLALVSFYVQQATIGSRRRIYMEALEKELCKDTDQLEVERCKIRPLAYNRYSWYLSSLEVNKGYTSRIAAILFGIVNVIPLIIFASVLVTSCWRLWDKHQPLPWVVGVLSFVVWVWLYISFLRLGGDKSRLDTWKKIPDAVPALDSDAEEAAIVHVMALEQAAGRDPRDVRTTGLPYDVESPPRRIDVKAFSGSARTEPLPLEHRQVTEAQANPDHYYLYVVDNLADRDEAEVGVRILHGDVLLAMIERSLTQITYWPTFKAADYDQAEQLS